MEQKGEKQIHQLEDEIETKQKNNKKLRKLIYEEKEKLKMLKEQGWWNSLNLKELLFLRIIVYNVLRNDI